MRRGDVNDTVIALFQDERAVARGTDQLALEDVDALLERVDVRVDPSGRVKLTQSELLMERACLARDD
jgi:hypothetical protein